MSAVIDGSFCVAGGGDGQQPLSHLVLKVQVEKSLQDVSKFQLENPTFFFFKITPQKSWKKTTFHLRS